MHRVKNIKYGQGIGVSLEFEVLVIIRHAYASGYGNWHGNSNFIMFEGFKMIAVQYGLTYKDYAVCMAERNLFLTHTQTFNFFEKCMHRYKLLIKKSVHAVNCNVHWMLIMQISCLERKVKYCLAVEVILLCYE